MSGPRAIIVGGGIGGLTAALALSKAGVRVSVFERAKDHGTKGLGVGLWSGALKVLDRLGVGTKLRRFGYASTRGLISTEKGDVIQNVSLPDVSRGRVSEILCVERSLLLNIMQEALPQNTIEWSTRFIGFEENSDAVTAYFADRPPEKGDLLIGADGFSSLVRLQLWQEQIPQSRFAGYTVWRGVSRAYHEDVVTEIWGPGQRFGSIKIDPDHVHWYAVANTKEGFAYLPQESQQRYLLEKFGSWPFQTGELIESIPANQLHRQDVYDRPFRGVFHEGLFRWGKGRVTLLGEAAHPFSHYPNFGLGSCLSIEDAFSLASCVTQFSPDVKLAIRYYEQTRRPKTNAIIEATLNLSRVIQWENPIALRWRNVLLKLGTHPIRVSPFFRGLVYEPGFLPPPFSF